MSCLWHSCFSKIGEICQNRGSTYRNTLVYYDNSIIVFTIFVISFQYSSHQFIIIYYRPLTALLLVGFFFFHDWDGILGSSSEIFFQLFLVNRVERFCFSVFGSSTETLIEFAHCLVCEMVFSSAQVSEYSKKARAGFKHKWRVLRKPILHNKQTFISRKRFSLTWNLSMKTYSVYNLWNVTPTFMHDFRGIVHIIADNCWSARMCIHINFI